MNSVEIVKDSEHCRIYAEYPAGANNNGEPVYFGCPERRYCSRFQIIGTIKSTK